MITESEAVRGVMKCEKGKGDKGWRKQKREEGIIYNKFISEIAESLEE